MFMAVIIHTQLKEVRFNKLPEIVVANDPVHHTVTLIVTIRESRDGIYIMPPGITKRAVLQYKLSQINRSFFYINDLTLTTPTT